MMLLHYQDSTSGTVNNDRKNINILRNLAYTTRVMCQVIQLMFSWYELDIFVLTIFSAIMH
jgi:hypothetical protein